MKKWLIKKKSGLFCEPGNFYIDPIRPVEKALPKDFLCRVSRSKPRLSRLMAMK